MKNLQFWILTIIFPFSIVIADETKLVSDPSPSFAYVDISLLAHFCSQAIIVMSTFWANSTQTRENQRGAPHHLCILAFCCLRSTYVLLLCCKLKNLSQKNQSRKISKSGRRKCSIKCFNAYYAMPYDEGCI